MTRSTVLFAALALLPMLASNPVRAQQTLPPPLLAVDLALTEIAARHPLSAAERQQVITIDQAQFQREPTWALQSLHQEAVNLKALRRLDPVRLADWRKRNLVNTFFSADTRVLPSENKTYLAIYTHANPS